MNEVLEYTFERPTGFPCACSVRSAYTHPAWPLIRSDLRYAVGGQYEGLQLSGTAIFVCRPGSDDEWRIRQLFMEPSYWWPPPEQAFHSFMIPNGYFWQFR